jgi:hypothetical protein
MQPISLAAAVLAAALSTAQAKPTVQPTDSAIQFTAIAVTGATQERICMHLRCPGFN